MKKYITVAALLAAGTAFANAEAVSADILNKNLDDYLIESGYTAGDNFLLTFTLDGGGNTYDILNLSVENGWFLRSQSGRYVGVSSAENKDVGANWIGGEANVETFSNNLEFDSTGWLIDRGTNNALNGATVSINTQTLFGTTVQTLQIDKGSNWVYATIVGADKITLDDIDFTLAHSSATLSINGAEAYNLLTPVPEPSAFGLLAGIGALALVAARRRRKA